MRVLFLIVFIFVSISFATMSKHILVLQSYNKGLFWSDNISKGIEDILLHEKHYEITTEYMDTKKNNEKDYLDSLYKLFYKKMEKQKFDAVIAADNEAVEFVFKNKDMLFKDIPLIFCGIDKRDPGIDIQKVLDSGITLILESKEIAINVDFILKTMPNLEYLYILNDYTGASILVNHSYEEQAQKVRELGIKVKVDFEGDLEQTRKNILSLPKNSAILFGSLFRNKEGNYIPYYDVNTLLNLSKAPVFAVSSGHFGKGVMGGYLLGGYDLGKQSAIETIKILEDKKTKNIEPIVVPAKWKFDYKVLKKHHIPIVKIPKNSEIINLPKSFFDRNKKLVEYAFILFPFLLLSLIFAVINNYQKYKLSQKLKAQSELQEVLLNNIQSSIFWIDKDNRVKGCNNSFCKLLNLKEKNIIGEEICKLFSVICNLSVKESIEKLEEIEFRLKDRIYRLRSQVFLNEQGKNSGIVSIIVDITEKKQLEVNTQFIVQQSKLAEIGEMLSAIVHQWKNPLVELSAVAHKIMYYGKKNKLTSENIKEFYDNIMTQTIYMSETIDGFRDFIRPSNKPKTFNVDTGLTEVLSLLSHSLKFTHIELDYKNNSKEGCLAYGYPNEFKQVVVSIINNARDAIVEKKGRDSELKGEIKLSLYKCDDEIKLYIKDNGIGIDDEVKEQIFNAFFTTKSKGDGFGLYMARLIIEEKMNGRIDIEKEDDGTKVCIHIPINESIK